MEDFSNRSDITPDEFDGAQRAIQKLSDYYDAKMVGQQNLKFVLTSAILADGHILLESVPGLAKTTAAKTIADAVDEKPAEVAEAVEAVAAEAAEVAEAAVVPAEKLFSKGFAHWLGADDPDDAEFEPFEEFVGSLLYKDAQPTEAEAGPTAEELFKNGFAHWIGADADEDEKGGLE